MSDDLTGHQFMLPCDCGRPHTVPTMDSGQRSGAKSWELLGRSLVLVDENNGREFLKRWRLLQTPLFSVFLHRMQVPDPGTDLHDHPWGFLSIVLCGGYHERTADARRPWHERHRHRRRWSIAGVRLDEVHSIDTLDRSPTWTLVVTGPTRRRWGFMVGSTWQDWEREYDYARRYPARG